MYQNKRYRTKTINWNQYQGDPNPIVYVPKWDKCFKLLRLGIHGNGSRLKAYIQDVYNDKKQYWIEAKQMNLVEEDLTFETKNVNTSFITDLLSKTLDEIIKLSTDAFNISKVIINDDNNIKQNQSYYFGRSEAFMEVYSLLFDVFSKVCNQDCYNKYFKETQFLIKVLKRDNFDIENYIHELLKARKNKDLEQEQQIRIKMSNLLVDLQQDITTMLDYFQKYT